VQGPEFSSYLAALALSIRGLGRAVAQLKELFEKPVVKPLQGLRMALGSGTAAMPQVCGASSGVNTGALRNSHVPAASGFPTFRLSPLLISRCGFLKSARTKLPSSGVSAALGRRQNPDSIGFLGTAYDLRHFSADTGPKHKDSRRAGKLSVCQCAAETVVAKQSSGKGEKKEQAPDKKLAAFREVLSKARVDAYIVPSEDPHQSEYSADCFNRRAYISGFTGSAGTAVITKDKAALWTDGRYFLQVSGQPLLTF
jgi:hypothetical protein